jgi:sodium-dependent dicarboxylate transporter 2/3/5
MLVTLCSALAALSGILFRVLTVDEMEGIPWNIILLFGGAMSIGYCLYDTRPRNGWP